MTCTIRHLLAAAVLLLIALLLIVGTRTVTLNDLQAQETAAAPAQAAAIASAARVSLPPTLLAPDDASRFDNAAAVTLKWMWYRPLADDEFYDVRVWRASDPENGLTWTKDQSLDLRDWLLYQQPGDFDWRLGVVRRNADGSGAEISDLTAIQHFSMSAIDMQMMTLPPGFTATYYARLPFTQPTVITFGEDGALYALSVEGDIARLTDADGDGFAETADVIYTDTDNQLDHAVGMTFHDGVIYVSDAGRVSTLTDSDGDGMLDTVTPIVTGLPSQWYPYHSNNGIAFGPDGKLYIGVGSTTDHGPLRTQYEASILRMNPDGSDLETFATGFRNPYDIVFTPNGELFTSDNSPDLLDSTLTYLPPEEIDYVQQGKNYGFPDQFGFPDLASDTMPPVVDLDTSSASSGITYQDFEQLPGGLSRAVSGGVRHRSRRPGRRQRPHRASGDLRLAHARWSRRLYRIVAAVRRVSIRPRRELHAHRRDRRTRRRALHRRVAEQHYLSRDLHRDRSGGDRNGGGRGRTDFPAWDWGCSGVQRLSFARPEQQRNRAFAGRLIAARRVAGGRSERGGLRAPVD